MKQQSKAKNRRGHTPASRWLALLACAWVWAWSAQRAEADPSILQPIMTDWVNAAKTSRADIWLIGDSIAGTFDAGFSDAAAKHFGLAGTGVANDAGGGNGSYTITPTYPLGSNGWDISNSAVRADRQDHILSVGEPITAGASSAQFFDVYGNGGYLGPQAPYDWHPFTPSPNSRGSPQAKRLIPGPPY